MPNRRLTPALLLLAAPTLAAPVLDRWTGSGPYASGLGNRVIDALLLSSDGMTVYAGTGSGTVFVYAYSDTTAPVLDAVGVSGIGRTAASLSATSSEAATGYWIVVARGATAPDATGVKAGVDYPGAAVAAHGSGAMAAAAAAGFPVTGLAAGTDYDLYVVAQDGSVNANFSSVAKVPFSTPPNTWTITAAAAPGAGGSVDCTPNPVTQGGTGTCTATANPGYLFANWSGDCSGSACELAAVTGDRSVTAHFTPVTRYTGATPTGTGQATLSVAGDGCALTDARFIAPPPGLPARFPHGVVDFTLAGCVGTATVTVTYPTPLPAGATYWKEVAGAYADYPASLGPDSATFTLTDGGAGDDDPTVGVIHDPGGVAIPLASGEPQAIPALGPMGLALMSAVLALAGIGAIRRGRPRKNGGPLPWSAEAGELHRLRCKRPGPL